MYFPRIYLPVFQLLGFISDSCCLLQVQTLQKQLKARDGLLSEVAFAVAARWKQIAVPPSSNCAYTVCHARFVSINRSRVSDLPCLVERGGTSK